MAKLDPFLSLDCARVEGGRGGAIQGKEGIKFCHLATSTKVDPEAQPVVYLNCGHVQGRHAWGATSENGKRTCPICLGETDTAQLKIGSESGKFSFCSTESVRPEKQTFVSINLKCGFFS